MKGYKKILSKLTFDERKKLLKIMKKIENKNKSVYKKTKKSLKGLNSYHPEDYLAYARSGSL